MGGKAVKRSTGWGGRRVAFGVLLLTALVGTVWAQGRGMGRGQERGQGRGQALGQAATQAGVEVIPPPAGGTAANPSGLPRAMGDDTFTQALQRTLVATMVMNAKNEALTPLHLRYELTMVDYKNKQHAGTYEMWVDKDGVRTAIHTDVYDADDLAKGGRVWAAEKGLRPLRIMEFAEVHAMDRSVLLRAMRGNQKMKPRTVDGVSLICGGDKTQGVVCFDPATGYVAQVIDDATKVMYQDWKPVGPLHLATTVSQTYGKHELFEAKLVEASVDVPQDALAVPAGATEEPAGTKLDELLGIVPSVDPHPQLPANMRKPEEPKPIPAVSGQAQLRVWVDEKGMVSKAVVEDADDKGAAAAGYSRATLLEFIPDVVNGHPVSFETTYYMHSEGGGGMGRGGMGRGDGGMGNGGMGGGGMGGGGMGGR